MEENSKLRVALLFGGRSTEHEVSMTSAIGVLKHIDREKYDVIPIRISKEGQWIMLNDPLSLQTADDLETRDGKMLVLGGPKIKGFFKMSTTTGDEKGVGLERVPVDVVFPILHGTFGEDGTLQGALAIADLPCVGSGVMASAVGMDKVMMKQIFFQNDLPATEYIWFLRKDWIKHRGPIVKAINDEIQFPCFVKPANTGSSVGVYKAHDEKELLHFIDQACEYDRKVLVEKGVDARELECSVLGNDEPEASLVGEIIPCKEFYDYEAKYLLEGSEIVIPADIPVAMAEQLQKFAVSAFKAVDCAGLARVDFLMDKNSKQIYVNEINTIPGFTPISMYPKLWEATGISYSELIDRLIQLAIGRYEDLSRSKFLHE